MSMFSVFVFMMTVHLPVARATTIKPVVISKPTGACLCKEKRDAIVTNLKDTIQVMLDGINPNCGPGRWHQVAHLKMSDPSQHCSSAWWEYNTGGIRVCRRSATSSGSCLGISYTTG